MASQWRVRRRVSTERATSIGHDCSRDLETQVLSRYATSYEQTSNRVRKCVRKCVVVQGMDRDVYGNLDHRACVQPRTALSKRGFQHPSGLRFDEADVLARPNELVWCNHAALRMAPAHQCLDAS